jgi:glycosyltransferase involved in cell wall biosynthesis
MTVIVGSEIAGYRSAVGPTGVPRVVREAHRHLVGGLAAAGCDLVPLVTRDEQFEAGMTAAAYASNDPVLMRPTVMPEQVDCALLLDPGSPIDFGRLLSRKREAGLAVVAMINDLLPLEHPEWFPVGAERHYRVLVQQILHVADHLVLPSKEVKRAVDRLGWRIRPQVHVIPLGSPFDQLSPALSPGERTDLLCVATIEPRKGHATLLRAYDLLRQEGRDITLTLVGRIGWESDALVDRIRAHPDFGGRLRWRRHVDDDVVRSALQQGALAIMPTEGEGFGFFLEEALSAGAWVVATDLPVLRERPYPNVTLVPGTAEGLAQGVRQAAGARPAPLSPTEVRSMADFSCDLQAVILEAVGNIR